MSPQNFQTLCSSNSAVQTLDRPRINQNDHSWINYRCFCSVVRGVWNFKSLKVLKDSRASSAHRTAEDNECSLSLQKCLNSWRSFWNFFECLSMRVSHWPKRVYFLDSGQRDRKKRTVGLFWAKKFESFDRIRSAHLTAGLESLDDYNHHDYLADRSSEHFE